MKNELYNGNLLPDVSTPLWDAVAVGLTTPSIVSNELQVDFVFDGNPAFYQMSITLPGLLDNTEGNNIDLKTKMTGGNIVTVIIDDGTKSAQVVFQSGTVYINGNSSGSYSFGSYIIYNFIIVGDTINVMENGINIAFLSGLYAGSLKSLIIEIETQTLSTDTFLLDDINYYDFVAPNPVEGLPGSHLINLKWNSSTGATNYKIKVGINSLVYTVSACIVGPVTEAVLASVTNDVPFYIAVAVCDGGGIELSDTSFEITRTATDSITFPTFRTENLKGYLPNVNIVGNLPFKIPTENFTVQNSSDFDFEIETSENLITATVTLTRSSLSYDIIGDSNVVEIDNVRDENGVIYTYLNDYYLFRDRVYWIETNPTMTVGLDYVLNYKYAATITIHSSNRMEGIVGSSDAKIKYIDFTNIEDVSYYLRLYDDYATNTTYVNIYTTLVDASVSTNLYAYANIDSQSGYYAATTDNLLKDHDPSFENNSSILWSSATLSITAASSSAFSKFDSKSMYVSGTINDSSDNNIYVSNLLVDPVTQYVFSGYNKILFPGAGYNSYVKIDEFDIYSVTIASSIVSSTIASATDWTRFILPFTTAAATDHLRINLITQTTSGTTTISSYWDGMQLERSAFVTPFTETYRDDNTIDANILKNTITLPIIGSLSLKFTPSLPTTIFLYTPFVDPLMNFQNGNAVKSFEINFNDRISDAKRDVTFRTRVAGTAFETLWSDVNDLVIPQDYLQLVNERLMTILPDEHVYNKDILKQDVADRDNNVYKVLGTYSNEFDEVYYGTDIARADNFTDISGDGVFENNFATYFNQIKPVNMQWCDFRNVVKESGVAATEGSTLAAIKRMGNAFTGVDPYIFLVRDYDWWILNGNMIPNPSFEFTTPLTAPVPYWDIPTLTVVSSLVGAEISMTPIYGINALKQVVGTSTALNFETTSDFLPIDRSRDYIFSYYYYTPTINTVNNIYANTYYYDKNNSLLGSQLITSVSMVNDYWDRFTGTLIVPDPSIHFSNWTDITPTPTLGLADRVWVNVASDSDGSNLIASDYSGDLYTSLDYGVTWTSRFPTGTYTFNAGSCASDADGTNLVVAVGSNTVITSTFTLLSGKVWVSSDSGVTWINRTPASITLSINAYGGTASDFDGSNLMVATSGTSATLYSGRIWLSSDAGVSWLRSDPGGDVERRWKDCVSGDLGVHLIAVSKNTVIGVDTGKVYTSSDSGASWTERNPGGLSSANWWACASSSDGSSLIVATSPIAVGGTGRIFVSTDSGVTWSETNPVVSTINKYWAFVAMSKDGTTVSAGDYGTGLGGRLYSSIDAGVTWKEEIPIGSVDKNWNWGTLSIDGSSMIAQSAGVTLNTGRIYRGRLADPISKVKVSLGFNGQTGNIIYFDGVQFEEGTVTPYEDFEYNLEDPLYPEIIPPTLWDKKEMAYSVILQIRNPYGFTLDQDLIRTTILKFVPAHTKIYIQFLTADQSLNYMTWDESLWDSSIWY